MTPVSIKFKNWKVVSFLLLMTALFIGGLITFVNKDVQASSTCNFDNIVGSQVVLSSSCSISKGSYSSAFEGPVVASELLIDGKTLSIGSDSSLVISPGQSIRVINGGQINITKNTGGLTSGANGMGAILEGGLYLPDADNDTHPDSDVYVYNSNPTATISGYIQPDTTVINGTTGDVIVDCDPADPAVFEARDCILSAPSYTAWSNYGTCGQYQAGIQAKVRTWTKSVTQSAACDGTACGATSGTEYDYSNTCGVCTPGATTASSCGVGACTRVKTITCGNDGQWIDDCVPGTGTAETCNNVDDNCDGSIDNGIASRTRYSSSSASCGTACSSQSQTCSAGVWSGTYTLTSCTPSSRTGYQSSVMCNTACVSEAQTCLASGWSGTYTYGSCTVEGYITWYRDLDGDGYGYLTSGTSYCPSQVPAGFVANSSDCDDSTASITTSDSRVRYQSSSVACGTACSSQNQYCASGTWNPTSYTATSCTASTRTKYLASSVCGTSCSSEAQTCQTNGAWSGTYTYNSCSTAPNTTWYYDNDGDGYGNPSVTTSACSQPADYVSNSNDCDDFNGGITTSGTRTRYQPTSVACGTACNSESQSCTNGTWTGSYTSTSCTASTRTRYSSNIACDTACLSQAQTCQTNGTWTGTYAYASCSYQASSTWYKDGDGDGYGQSGTHSLCGTPAGYVSSGTMEHYDCDDSNSSIWFTASRTRYDKLSVACGDACQSEVQTCSEGSWNTTPGYIYTSCTPSTRTRYYDNDPCGGSCSPQTQTCQYTGSWSGTYAYSSCSVATNSTWYRDADNDGYGNPGVTTTACSKPTGYVSNNYDCNDSNSGITTSSSRTRYSSSSVSCGTACSSQTQTCSNGSWTGTYTGTSCTASSRTRYSSSYGCSSGITCSSKSETQYCLTSGSWSGSYSYSSCSNYVPTTYYYDGDGDGYGSPSTSNTLCAPAPTNYVSNNYDCNDSNSGITTSSSRTRYLSSSVSCGTACSSQAQTCSNGTWTGTYTGTSCSPSTRTAYNASSSCSGCSSESQTCTSSGWTGSYTATSCYTSTCSAGYYCSGTSCPQCGSNEYYCTGGSRHSVSAGYYSTGGTPSTRTGQSACGGNAYYCSGGVRNSVSTGYYSTGGTSTTRTGESACSSATSYCSGGIKYGVSTGYYTTPESGYKTGQSICTSGWYCPTDYYGAPQGVRYLCPSGYTTPSSGYTQCVPQVSN